MTDHAKIKLVAVETHPIQYKAPLFRAIAADPRFDLTVLYAMIPDAVQQGAGFGVSFEWDMPLLEGYRYRTLTNVAREPSVTRFRGCDTPEIYTVLKTEQPDAVLVNGWVVKSCLQALWACRRLDIPCLVRGEANLMRPRVWWKHAIHRWLLSQYDAYLYIGSANRDFYRFHGCRESRLFFAPYGVDHDYFSRESISREGRRGSLRSEMSIGPGARVFLFAGKLEEKKHPDHAIRAAGMLPPELKAETQLLFAGDGPLRPGLEALAASLGVRAHFAGFMNQKRMPDAYAVADVLILPSDAGETWGLVVNEAMASGLPAIVSDRVGCSSDLVIPDDTGYIYSFGDLEALRDRMALYVRDSGLSLRHGRDARLKIRPLGIPAVVEGIAKAISAIVE